MEVREKGAGENADGAGGLSLLCYFAVLACEGWKRAVEGEWKLVERGLVRDGSEFGLAPPLLERPKENPEPGYVQTKHNVPWPSCMSLSTAFA